MQTLLLAIIMLGCVLAIRHWRWGLVVVILIGLIQDPLRKMIPGTPGIFAMSIVPVWLASLASGLFSGELSPKVFFGSFPRLGRWIVIFIAYLIIPIAISATYSTGSWQITLLGIFIYSAAMLTLFAGYSGFKADADRVRFMAYYALLGSVFLVGGLLENALGSDAHVALGTASMGTTWVTHRTGESVYMLSGFFRGPDIMGWHASLVFMIAVVLAIRTKGIVRYLWIGLAIWALVGMWLCGRRKIISMIPIFGGYMIFLFFYYRNVRKLFSAIGLAIMIGGLGGHFISSYVYKTEVYDFYMTSFSEAGDQIKRHGFDSVLGTVAQSGFWGHGLGMGQQGTHHIKVEKPRLWHESGPTKIVVELGVPGALIFVVIFFLLFRTCHAVLRHRAREPDFILTAGIISILVSNLVAAIVSAQIYTDPFIAFMLALLTGMILSSVYYDSAGEKA